MTIPQHERDKLERLKAERDLVRSNLRGWRAQEARSGRPADRLLAEAIAEATADLARLTKEILDLQDADRHERQRAARLKHADQAVKIGRSLPDKGKE